MELNAMTDRQLAALAAGAQAVLSARATLAEARGRAERIVVDREDDLEQVRVIYHKARARGDGAVPWVAPTGPHDAYYEGATVTHSGFVWRSLSPDNWSTPGAAGAEWEKESP